MAEKLKLRISNEVKNGGKSGMIAIAYSEDKDEILIEGEHKDKYNTMAGSMICMGDIFTGNHMDHETMLCMRRHGLAVFLFISMCVSLMFVYYKSSRQSQTESVPVIKKTSPKHELHTPAMQGYINIINHKPLRMHCKTCVLVTSSGHLTGSNRGNEIDQAECVIRMNDAPTKGYGKDVGNKTSLRVIAHSSMQYILRNRNELLNVSHGTVFIFWGPTSYMRKDGKGLVYNNLKGMNQILPQLKLYVITRQKMLQFDELFKRETGKDRKVSNTWLSTGWFTMIIAIELCDRIAVYGMAPPNFCRDRRHRSVPYHYYEPSGPDECRMYISHEWGQKGSHHRFITEKKVFAKWAQIFNILFFQPDWKPESLAINHAEIKPLLG
ncbi:alpha-N-acetylgalactosaminide alpha-2,6-sialyltransferase 5 [Latimeria chalumnae]|uniref:alpha-N-acetylgalactosaminide alpha-2,6-sialyltransferase 5 n=1 Tax=Latimeria chalumnae TaxID=7897 RepID=UPI00313AE7CE